jgi:TRAP-type C4-dicarboxylate transport system substrate-binding protein
MRRIFLLAFIITLIISSIGGSSLFAQRGSSARETLEVKIASPLPKESPWGRTLDRIAAEWNKVTSGQVRLRVLHGGTEGGEGKMRLSLASNTIQAAVFTSFGLSSINPAVLTMSAPFLIRTDSELEAVMKEVEKDLEAKINSGDFFIISWSKAGFVNIFSKDPVHTPDELKRMRIASNAEANDMNTAFKTMGYQVVETDWIDVGPKLASGAVLAIYQNPAGVAAYQLHSYLKNMLSINLAPVLGGIVINQVTWKKIAELNPRFQTELLRATRSIAEEFDQSMQKTMTGAVNTMAKEGLKVNKPTPAQEQLWYSDVEKVIPALLSSTYDRDLYQKISSALVKYRGGR